jgi:hypothetical protein
MIEVPKTNNQHCVDFNLCERPFYGRRTSVVGLAIRICSYVPKKKKQQKKKPKTIKPANDKILITVKTFVEF